MEVLPEQTDLETQVRKLLDSQKFAVLSTQARDFPHLSLVALAATEDLRTVLLATDRATRKYENMVSRSGTALLVDNRSNEAADIQEAVALTIKGTAREVPQSERESPDKIFLDKHPHMKEFLFSSSAALIRVDVESYSLVSRFQDVVILNMNP